MGPSAEEPQLKHSNRHHVYPKSRIPAIYGAGNRKLMGGWLVLQKVSIVSHNALHGIFGNRTPEEQLEFLKKICRGGFLIAEIYIAYKELFDTLFGANISFQAMVATLKKWDISDVNKKKYANKFAALLKVLNNDVMGGIPLRKFKLS